MQKCGNEIILQINAGALIVRRFGGLIMINELFIISSTCHGL